MRAGMISCMLLLCVIFMSIICGCGGSGHSGENPVIPDDESILRGGMDFFGYSWETLFGADDPASDVDLASVVWGQESAYQDELGSIVVFPDDSSWVAAVGIENPEDDPNYAVVRFLKNDGSTMSDAFEVPIGELVEDRMCRFPRIDCTYTEDIDEIRKVFVYVVYRYGLDDYDWNAIWSSWDIWVIKMVFKYNLNDDWELLETVPMPDDEMQLDGTGQTTPDIAVNQFNGDIYCAWVEMPGTVDLLYKRYSHELGRWAPAPWELECTYRRHSSWFPSIDVGKVSGLPNTVAPVRIVGFAYTAHFEQLWEPGPGGEKDDLWGFRPVVGWWEIGDSYSDTYHNAQAILVNRTSFDPVDPNTPPNYDWGNKYEAGMIRVDIPGDDAEGHGGAVAFMQDTCDLGYGDYEAWGISSLHPNPLTGFVRLSYPGEPGYELFDQAVFPSLAIHEIDGTMASVTFLAREDPEDNWAAWATLWDLDAISVAEPTTVYYNAMGKWSLGLADIMHHDWGSSSSLAVAGANDEYWAAWSDKYDEYHDTPIRILGRMGFADE